MIDGHNARMMPKFAIVGNTKLVQQTRSGDRVRNLEHSSIKLQGRKCIDSITLLMKHNISQDQLVSGSWGQITLFLKDKALLMRTLTSGFDQ